MVVAKFYTEPEKGLIKLTVNGHAGMNAPGHDIVCSACSILAKTLEQNVMIFNVRDMLRVRPDVKDKKGDFIITCKTKKDTYDEVARLFLYIQTGYQLLAYNYPDYVAVETFGDKD